MGGQDGNNGSGNDPDCEDDNRGVGVPGHCKAKPHGHNGHQHTGPASDQPSPEQEQSAPAQPEQAQSQPGLQQVPTSTVPAQQAPGVVTLSAAQGRPVAAPAAQVLGISAVRPRSNAVRAQVAGISAAAPTAAPMPSASTLPNTGAPGLAVPLAGAGALLLAGGGGLMLRRRSGKATS